MKPKIEQAMKAAVAADIRRAIPGRSGSYDRAAERLTRALAAFIERPETAPEVAELWQRLIGAMQTEDRLAARRKGDAR